MPPSEFSPTSGDWGKLEIRNLAQMTNVSNKKLLNAAKYQGKTNRVGGGGGAVVEVTRVND